MSEARSSELRAVKPGQAPSPPAFDRPRIERAVREILLAIGEDPDRDGLRRTPVRIASLAPASVSNRRMATEAPSSTKAG